MKRAGLRGMLLVVLVAAGTGLRAQEGGLPRALASEGTLRFFVDAASFRGTPGYALQEFYILLDGRQLQFVPEGSRFVGQIDLSVTVSDSLGQTVAREAWSRSLSVEALRELREAGAPVRDLMGFSLKPGSYAVVCEVEDTYGDRKGKAGGTVAVPDYEGPGLSLSRVMFVADSGPVESGDRFVRHGRRVLPNTTHTYAAGQAVIFYHEVYNLAEGPDAGRNTFDVRYQLADSSGLSVAEAVDRRYPRGGESAVLVDSVSTKDLPAGRYSLLVSAFDRANRALASTQADLTVAPVEALSGEATGSQMANLRYYRDIRWVASEKDLKTYDALGTQEARDRFLKVFWQKLDPTSDTSVNERLVEHIRRMRFSDDNFSAGHGNSGIDSDKGRVYVHYGPPTDREYRSAVDSPKPYEIWTYDLSGACEFVFRDRRGVGVYELVHSTCPGELFNPNWQSEI